MSRHGILEALIRERADQLSESPSQNAQGLWLTCSSQPKLTSDYGR